MDKLDQRILGLMLEKTNRLIEICNKYSFEEIQLNYLVSDSLQYEFEKLYEDVSRLSVNFVLEYPNFPINQLRSIRNRVAHDYASVIIRILYDTVKVDIVSLKSQIQEILK